MKYVINKKKVLDLMYKQNIHTQKELAEKLGISRGTFSKWLKENSVSPKQYKGQQKLYDETVIEQYKKIKASSNGNSNRRKDQLTTVQLLHEALKDKQREIDYIKKQLDENKKDMLLKKSS